MGYFIEQFPVKEKKGDTDEQGEKQKKKKKKKEVAVSECVAALSHLGCALISGLRVPGYHPDQGCEIGAGMPESAFSMQTTRRKTRMTTTMATTNATWWS